jgi:hypothetical protein
MTSAHFREENFFKYAAEGEVAARRSRLGQFVTGNVKTHRYIFRFSETFHHIRCFYFSKPGCGRWDCRKDRLSVLVLSSSKVSAHAYQERRMWGS